MKRRPLVFGTLVATLIAASATMTTTARSAGLYFSDRGVRPMGRAGAFVAGADDLGATWYNPAGIVDAGPSFLADFAWLRFSDSYTRQLQVVDADGTIRNVNSPTIQGSSPVLPLPTLVGSFALDDDRRWIVALGVLAPYVALASYPDALADGSPSPARYTLGSFNGSALALPGAWIAWKPVEWLRVGAGVMALAGIFESTITFSASPQDRLLGAPEQPEFDAASQVRAGPIFAPSVSGGVIVEPDPHVRIGLSAQSPFYVDAPATIKVRLPSDVAFDGASINGDQARISFTLPGIFRAGVEVRPLHDGRDLRIELAYVREFWGEHQTIEIKPQGMTITGITAGPPSVTFPNISIPRGFQDSNSFRLGAEGSVKVSGYRVDLRGGVAYESSAVPADYLSLSSLDFTKIYVMSGGSLHIGKRWRFDAVLGHTFASTTYVDPATAQIPRINPLKGNAPMEAVNGGTYGATADLIGVGMAYAM
ncbi:MAG: OmpP1/FadL family transporter [Polyangiales bacterium]